MRDVLTETSPPNDERPSAAAAPAPTAVRWDADEPVLGDPAAGARAGRIASILIAIAGLLFGAALYVGGPLLVERAGRDGIGISAIDRALKGKSPERIEKNVSRARKLAVAASAGGLLGAGLVFLLTRPGFLRRMVGGATPGALGAIRALVCGTLLLIVLQDDLGDAAVLPPEMRRPMGLLEVVRQVPGVNALLASAAGLRAVDWGTTLLLALGMLGLASRVVVPLAAIGFFVYAGVLREYSWFTHQGLVPLYVLAVLAFMPSGDGFSLDRLRRQWRGLPVPPRDVKTLAYGWYRYACWTPVAILYTFAGLSKLRNGGWDWWAAPNMRSHLIGSTLQPMAYEWEWSLMLIDAPDALFAAFGIAGILTELAGGLVLVWPRVRWLVGLALMGLHTGIWLFQNILFYDLILLQLMLFDFRAIRRWVGRRLEARCGEVKVLGGASPLVRRILPGLDLFERLDWSAAHREGAGANGGPLRVQYRGIMHEGAAAWRTVARVVPALWPVVWLPWPASDARRLDGVTKAQRDAKAQATGGASPAGAAPVRLAPGLAARLAVCGMAAILVANWVLRTEPYPLTGVQMYSSNDRRHNGTITYAAALVHYDSGAVERAPLDRAIEVFGEARYRRVLDMALSQDRRAIAEKVFRTAAQRLNRGAPPGRRVERFEVQTRRWNYRTDPDDPDHGEPIVRVFFDVGPHARPAIMTTRQATTAPRE